MSSNVLIQLIENVFDNIETELQELSAEYAGIIKVCKELNIREDSNESARLNTIRFKKLTKLKARLSLLVGDFNKEESES